MNGDESERIQNTTEERQRIARAFTAMVREGLGSACDPMLEVRLKDIDDLRIGAGLDLQGAERVVKLVETLTAACTTLMALIGACGAHFGGPDGMPPSIRTVCDRSGRIVLRATDIIAEVVKR